MSHKTIFSTNLKRKMEEAGGTLGLTDTIDTTTLLSTANQTPSIALNL